MPIFNTYITVFVVFFSMFLDLPKISLYNNVLIICSTVYLRIIYDK